MNQVASRDLLARLCLCVSIACGMSAGIYAGELPSEAGFPASCGIQLKSHNFTNETLDKVHELGFRIIRRGFYWKSVEKEQGTYDFIDYDAQMNHAKKLGLTVVGVLFSNNAAYEDDDQGGIQTEAGRKGFASFAAALAEHYQDHNVLWEVWNEPNVRTFWRKNGQHNSAEFAAEYTALVKEVAPAMLKADPKCFVMAGSVSNYWEPSYEWTESCFKHGILETGVRGWSVHPYGVKTPEEFAVGHNRTRELLQKYGAPDMPILDTERGFAVKETNEGWSGGSIERAREFQAWNFVRQFLIDQLHGVRLTVWYEWNGDEFGIADEDRTRPVYQACRVMLQQLNGYHIVKRLESDSNHDYVLLFEKASGERKLVAWTSPPPQGAPDEAIDHEVAIDLCKPPAIEVVDLNGEATTSLVSVGSLRMTLRGAPQYVAVPEGLEPGRCQSQRLPGPLAAQPDAQQPTAPSSTPAASPDGADLALFAEGTEWQFVKNTGEGSFTLGKDSEDKPIGILEFDFTKSTSKSWPYVLANVPVEIAEGAGELQLLARAPAALNLTFRILDSTGQTLQSRGRITGTGSWEAIRIPLNRKLEHWDGANDGKIHFPVKQLFLNVPKPREGEASGKVEFASAVAVADSAATGMAAAAVANAGNKPAQEKKSQGKQADPLPSPMSPAVASGNLNLFAEDASWDFVKNTGQGSFMVGKSDDGKPRGVLEYDFTKSKSRSTPYVIATAAVNIAEGARDLQFSARSPFAQQLTFRVVDSTGQTHQYKTRIKGNGEWEGIQIPLTGRLEHWGGAADGTIHFPIVQIVFSVPLPSEDHKSGKVEYADGIVVGESP